MTTYKTFSYMWKGSMYWAAAEITGLTELRVITSGHRTIEECNLAMIKGGE